MTDEKPCCGDESIEAPQTEEDWLKCIPLPEYLVRIPAGHIIAITGEEFWIDGNGAQLTPDQWKAKYGSDPLPAWNAKKKYLAEKARIKGDDHTKTIML